MSSVDISSLINESTMKTSKSFDVTSIEDEEGKNDSKEIQGKTFLYKRIISGIYLFSKTSSRDLTSNLFI